MVNQIVSGSDQEVKRTTKGTCVACVFGVLRVSLYLFTGLILLFLLAFTKAAAPLFILAFVAGLTGFIWQSRAAKKGCLMPLVIFSMVLGFEIIIISTAFYKADPASQNMVELRVFLNRHVPGFYTGVSKAFRSVAEKSDQLISSGLNALENIAVSDSDRNIATLESLFAANPGDAAIVLALADAYMTKGDVISVNLAVALYEALVEVAPGDSFLAKLADAYSAAHRPDKAFAAAVQRTWLPHANFAGIAKQIAHIAVKSQQLHRGIFELESLLQNDPVESEEINLLLAALYIDLGNSVRAEKLLDALMESAPNQMVVYQEAAKLRKTLRN